MKALISIGSNLGEPIENCLRAVEVLHEKVVSISSLYETSPVETIEEQRSYINLSAIIETSYRPLELLKYLQGIEEYFDRRRPHYHAARTMDIDVISLDESVESESDLIIPHPRSAMRLFVLLPTYEIAPQLAHELASKEASQFLRVLDVGETLVARLEGEIQKITRITARSF